MPDAEDFAAFEREIDAAFNQLDAEIRVAAAELAEKRAHAQARRELPVPTHPTVTFLANLREQMKLRPQTLGELRAALVEVHDYCATAATKPTHRPHPTEQ